MIGLRKQVFDILKFGGRFIFLIPIEERGEDDTQANASQPLIITHHNKIIINKHIDDDLKPIYVAHAVLAYILKHRDRAGQLLASHNDRALWNLASEIARTEVLEHFIQVPKNFASAASFGFPPDLSVEAYYKLLREHMEQLEEGHEVAVDLFGEGEEGEGDTSEESIEVDGIELDRGLVTEAALREAVEQALQTAQRAGLSGLADVRRAMEVGSPLRNPFDELLQFVNAQLGAQSEFRRQSFARPNRRYSSSIVIPAHLRTNQEPIAVVFDVSQSVQPFLEDLARALYGLAEAFPGALVVYYCDVEIITEERNFYPERVKEVPVGGGTDLGPIVDRLDASERFRHIIMVTDGETSWPKPPKHSRLYCWLIRDSGDVAVPEYIRVARFIKEK